MPTLEQGLTKLELHVLNWKDCQRCDLCKGRRRVCLFRGNPEENCDVLFVGEAPGESEDMEGVPFTGPAGQKLDMVFTRAQELYGGVVFACFTNLVGCYPREAKKTNDHRPPVKAILACQPRLLEVVELTQPRLIVCVGTLAAEWVIDGSAGSFFRGTYRVQIEHPSAVLRSPKIERPAKWTRMANNLHGAFVRFLGDPIPF